MEQIACHHMQFRLHIKLTDTMDTQAGVSFIAVCTVMHSIHEIQQAICANADKVVFV